MWPGLAAAKQLQRRGHRVVVVEGHGRPGGRVYTKKMEASTPPHQSMHHDGNNSSSLSSGI